MLAISSNKTNSEKFVKTHESLIIILDDEQRSDKPMEEILHKIYSKSSGSPERILLFSVSKINFLHGPCQAE